MDNPLAVVAQGRAAARRSFESGQVGEGSIRSVDGEQAIDSRGYQQAHRRIVPDIARVIAVQRANRQLAQAETCGQITRPENERFEPRRGPADLVHLLLAGTDKHDRLGFKVRVNARTPRRSSSLPGATLPRRALMAAYEQYVREHRTCNRNCARLTCACRSLPSVHC